MPLPDFDELFCIIDRPEMVEVERSRRRRLHFSPIGQPVRPALGKRLLLPRFVLLRAQLASFRRPA